MHKISYQAISLIISICLLFTVTGCTKSEDTVKREGAYLKKDITLPDGITNVYDVLGNGTDSITIFAIMEESDCILWETQDYGETWEEKLTIPKELKKSMIFCGTITKKGSLIFGAYSDILDKAGKEVDLLQEPKMYGSIDKNGNLKKFTTDIKDNAMIADFYEYDDRVFACDINGYYYEFTEKGVKCLNSEMETYGTPYDMLVLDDTLLGLGSEQLDQYDINTGKKKEGFSSFAQFCQNQMKDDSISPILCAGSEGRIYYLGQTGLFCYDTEKKAEEEIMDGAHYPFAALDTILQKFRVLDKDNYLLLTVENTMPLLSLYTYDKNAKASEQKELTIYALNSSDSLQAVIDGFREKYPNVQVHMEVGIDEKLGVTLKEAVRSLNVSLFAENGPDILVLDGLPVNSYIRQNKLVDLKKTASGQSLMDGIAQTYEKDGKLCAIPLGFSLLDLHATKDVLRAGTGLDEIAGQVEKLYKNGSAAVDRWEGDSIFSSLFYCYFPECLDGDKIDRDKLRDFYQNIEKIYSNSEYNWTVEVDSRDTCRLDNISPGNMQNADMMIHINETQLMAGKLGTLEDIQLAYLIRKKNPKVICNYFDDVLEKRYFAEMALGISASAKNSKEAEQFVEYAVSEEGQKRIAGIGESFPVNQVIFDHIFESEDTRKQEYVIEDRNGKNITLKAKNIEISDYKQWKKNIAGYQTAVYQDTVIKELVMTTAMDYINGALTLEESVDQCAQGVELYLNE